jgi:pilus assembly protein CpaF
LHPIGDTRLSDGSRVSAVLPPVALDGIAIAVRRFRHEVANLSSFGPPEVVTALVQRVQRRHNIVVFGPTGSGKTTLINCLAPFIKPVERVITVEDAAELRLDCPHVTRLETQPANSEGAGKVSTRELVRAALRLRPDRIIVGEVRGPEALDMVWALSSGHRGCLSTVHARSADDALARLETFVLLADSGLSEVAVGRQVRSAIDTLVGVERLPSGERQVVSIDDLPRPAGGQR